MPTYEFMCESCKKSFEVALTVAERAAANVQCPTCGRGEVVIQALDGLGSPSGRARGATSDLRASLTGQRRS